MQAWSEPVGQLTVRKVDNEIIRRLKIRAAEHGRSAEAEHREILKQVLAAEPGMTTEEWWQRADEFRQELGPMPDSTDFIRKMRDRR